MSGFFDLSENDRREVLEVASQASGRPFYILEKDIWVVRVLSALFAEEGGPGHMTFKGGTSLSKGYRLIRRFSEDIDLTVDIRQLIPELAAGPADPVPESNSQASRWRKQVEAELPGWVAKNVLGRLEGIRGVELKQCNSTATVTYDALGEGESYVAPRILLEFGARGTGEPNEQRDIVCDAAPFVPAVNLPTARVRTMQPTRTFWEKATAIHAFLASGKVEADRLSRHWYDLVLLSRHGVAKKAFASPDVAEAVAAHKARFFRVKSVDGKSVDYHMAIQGGLALIPEGEALAQLRADYVAMVDSGLVEGATAPTFDELMEECAAVEKRANSA